jgi:hypothetical protein
MNSRYLWGAIPARHSRCISRLYDLPDAPPIVRKSKLQRGLNRDLARVMSTQLRRRSKGAAVVRCENVSKINYGDSISAASSALVIKDSGDFQIEEIASSLNSE